MGREFLKNIYLFQKYFINPEGKLNIVKIPPFADVNAFRKEDSQLRFISIPSVHYSC